MEYTTYTLPNGLRMIHMPAQSPVAYCGYAVNAGARDEEPQEHGLAHFVEHMIFKGTEHHKANYILNRIESVGGELNAYTTKEETFVYSIFMKNILVCKITTIYFIKFDILYISLQQRRLYLYF